MGPAVIGPLVYLIGHILIISPRYYENVSAFGGMYVSNSSVSAIKAILTFGALVVLIMAYPWLDNKATKGRAINGKYAGEFIMLVLSTLLHDGVEWQFPHVLPRTGDGLGAHVVSGGFR